MDALVFINERDRMCAASECYHDCFANRKDCIFNYPANNNAKEQVKVVEDWSAAHPRKTRQSVFLEQYPHAYTQYGVIEINPCRMVRNYTYKDCNIADYSECRKEFWMQEVE